MRSTVSTGIYQDKRRIKKNNTYPIKIRVTFGRKTKYFKTDYSLTVEDFEKSYLSIRASGRYSLIKTRLIDIEERARTIARKLKPFSFSQFEIELYDLSKIENQPFENLFNDKIRRLQYNDQHKSADLYTNSKKKLKEYCTLNSKLFDYTLFNRLGIEAFLNWMIKSGLSQNTANLYLRNLRCIYNTAVEKRIIENRGKIFTNIASSATTQRPLSKEELQKIINLDLSHNKPQEKARDYWILSFYMYGLNMADLLRLRHTDLIGDRVRYVRKKSNNSTNNINVVTVVLIPQALSLIEKYKSESGTFLFSYLEDSPDEKDKTYKTDLFNKNIGKHMKAIAKENGIKGRVTSKFTRNSYATLAHDLGISTGHISRNMGHTSLSTTDKFYIGRLSEEVIVLNNNRVFNSL